VKLRQLERNKIFSTGKTKYVQKLVSNMSTL